VVSGQWSVVSGQWSVVSGQWSVVSGQWMGKMMNGFHANGLFDLLRDPGFQEEIRKRFEELAREREEELTAADYWGRREILAAIRRRVEREFAKEHCLF
jgi:hypothetical protein